jgi:hypothetical protein
MSIHRIHTAYLLFRFQVHSGRPALPDANRPSGSPAWSPAASRSSGSPGLPPASRPAGLSQNGPTAVDLRRLALERYTHLEDLLDGEPWDETDLAPGPRLPPPAMDLVVRVGPAGADGYQGRARPRIVQVLGGGQQHLGEEEEGAWLQQCGLSACSSKCQIM